MGDNMGKILNIILAIFIFIALIGIGMSCVLLTNPL